MPARVTFSSSRFVFRSLICVLSFAVSVLMLISWPIKSLMSFGVIPDFPFSMIASYIFIMSCCSLLVFSSLALVFSVSMFFVAFAMFIALFSSDLDSLVSSVRSVVIISSTSKPRFTGMTRNFVFIVRLP